MLLAKQVVLGILSVIIGYAMIAGLMTTIQLLPFFLYIILAILDFNKKDIRVWMLILAGLMLLLNLAVLSFIDVLVWLAIIIVYAKKK